MGKGHTPRPLSVDRTKFETNWAKTFGPKPVVEAPIAQKHTAQAKYCKDNNLPHFAHEYCGGHSGYDGYTFDECATSHLTYCRNCNNSWTD